MSDNTSNTSKALKGMSSQTIVTIVLGLVDIVSFGIMSRLLTQEDFGYYAAITAITTVFASFSETGLGSAIIQRKNITDKFVNNAYTLSLIFGITIAAILVALSKPLSVGLVDESLIIPLMLMSITLLFHNIISVNTSIMYRRLEFVQVGMINLVSLVITTIVAILLAYMGLGYYAILTKAVLATIITLVLSHIGAKTKFRLQLDFETVKSIFGFSGWLMISVFFRNLAQQLDRLLMSNMLSVNSLGAYNRPKEFIIQISSKINGIFDTALFPVLSGIQDDIEAVKRAYLRSFYYMNIFAIVLSLAFVFNSELIIRVFFGEKWMSILLTMQILSCMLVFNVDARLADCYLRSLGWTKQQFYFRVIEVVAQLIGILIGGHYGINGIAVSVVLVNILTIAAKNYYITKRLGIDTFKVIKTILKSWKVSYLTLPVLIILQCLLPHHLLGNVINAFIFCLLYLFAFVVYPNMIGSMYKNEVYPTIISKLKIKK
mgnify:FL=1